MFATSSRRLVHVLLAIRLCLFVHAKTIVVTSVEDGESEVHKVSLNQALQSAADGDTIAFNLPGVGPFLLPVPNGGFPKIIANDLTVDGYTQPGSRPNSNGIHAPNNAVIQIVIDGREGDLTPMGYDPSNPNAGYGSNEYAVLGVYDAARVVIRGLSILAPQVDHSGNNNYYGIAFSRDVNGDASGGRVSGCWIGVAPDGLTLTPTTFGITAFRHRDPDGSNPLNIDRITVGVPTLDSNPRSEFNVIVPSGLPILLEGSGHRISGNFLNILPNGLTEYNVALDIANFSNNNQSQGMIQIGHGGDNTVIGTDGDGVHDADEGNVMAGTLPSILNGYSHSLEFYDNNPGTNIVIAGNYVGVGIDGQTRFTNGVPIMNAPGDASSYRLGTDFDGVSDSLEGNLFANNWPSNYLALYLTSADPASFSFFDGISPTAFVSARGNSFMNNFSFPISPIEKDGMTGFALQTFYLGTLENVLDGVVPVLSPDSTIAYLSGTVPKTVLGWGPTSVDIYEVDLESLATGKFLESDGLTNAWVQGKTYLGTLDVDGNNDLDPFNSGFAYSIAKLNIKSGTWVTITANYSSSTYGSSAGAPWALTSPFSMPVLLLDRVPPVRLRIETLGTQVQITWSGQSLGYRLQSATAIENPHWQDVPHGTVQPVLLDMTAGPQFFRMTQ